MRIFAVIATIVVLYAQLVSSAVAPVAIDATSSDRAAVSADNDSDGAKVKFYVHTRFNRETPQALEPDVESVIRNIFDPLKPTTFSVHGFGGNKDAPENKEIVAAKLDVEDGNVIVVDWSELTPLDVEEAIAVVHTVGTHIGELIVLLHRHFLVRLEQIHVVGFSMGGHMAGLAGQTVFEHLGARVQRITGLDPGGSVFTQVPANQRLSADDALYVDVIHTNGGNLGFDAPLGHADFYPNGGRSQPNCPIDDVACSHRRAYELVREMWSRENEFISTKCASATDLSLERCTWVNVRMGENMGQEGVYYLETNGQPPYAKGSFVFAFF